MIEIFWSEQKKLIDAGYDFSYVEDQWENYIILTIDGPIVYKARVAITTPRNSDQIDFEDNYKADAVTNIEPRADELYYTKTEIDDLIAGIKPYIVKFGVSSGSAVVTDYENILASSPTKVATGQWEFNFIAGFFPRAIGQIGQSNIIVHYEYPMPTANPLDLVFKLASTGGNFDPNEVLIFFLK